MENRNSLASMSDRMVGNETTWSLPEGAIARFGQGIVETLAFSADGHYLAIGTRVGLYLYEVATMLPVALWGTERGAWKATFSPNGKWIATSDWDDNVKIWDVHRGTCLAEIAIGDYPSTLAFSPDSRWFATSHSETATLFVWCPETGEMLTKFTGETEKSGRFMPIAFSPDAHLIASTGREDVVSNGESVLAVEFGTRRSKLPASQDTPVLSIVSAFRRVVVFLPLVEEKMAQSVSGIRLSVNRYGSIQIMVPLA